MELLDQIVTLCLIFWWTATVFPQRLYHFTFRPAMHEYFNFSISSPTLTSFFISLFLSNSYPKGMRWHLDINPLFDIRFTKNFSYSEISLLNPVYVCLYVHITLFDYYRFVIKFEFRELLFPPNLLFLFTIISAILSPMRFHRTFRIFLKFFQKLPFGFSYRLLWICR